MPNAVFLQHTQPGQWRWLCCEDPVETVQARHPAEVLPAILAVENAAQRGLFAAGFVSYEAASGIDSCLQTHSGTGLPLVWFGLFKQVNERHEPISAAAAEGGFALGSWRPSVSQDQYRLALGHIKAYIAAGDTYQVNYTLRLRTEFRGDPWPLFLRLCLAQPSPYCAFIDTGEHVLCSASPELFFNLAGGVLTSRPMKGTAPRGLTCGDDRRLAEELAVSAKNRAENAMIVDMMRNDMGRIALPPSVRVSEAFKVEKYPTVYQMTSTVTARTAASFTEIMKALFPCASITGAPKIRTMQIIRELENDPRGVYTGCIGYLAPDQSAQFNVAIRTVAIDRQRGLAEYGVGGGIVWDSRTDEEYAECLTKAAVLTAAPADFQLLETILWEPVTGYFLLDKHVRRLSDSATYFDFALNVDEVVRQLNDLAAQFEARPQRVRLRTSAAGAITLEHRPLDSLPSPYRLRLAAGPIDTAHRFLYHKTTNRQVYQSARAGVSDCDDVVLWNDKGQVTETTIANIVIEKGGKLYTPPVACGLLSGVFRSHLLEEGGVEERVITVADLRAADKVFAVNSLRKWVPAVVARDAKTRRRGE